jgi:hypothetical protein
MRHLRFSLAGLMGFVLFVALGLAALRCATPVWVATTFVLTRLTLGLAVLNAAYSHGVRRAWWLGFSLLGWTWLIAIATREELTVPTLPASSLLRTLKPYLGPREIPGPATIQSATRSSMENMRYNLIAHDLCALLFAFIGGMAGRVGFAHSGNRDAPPEHESTATGPAPRKRWLRPVLCLWLLALLGASLAAVRSRWNAGFWVGVTFLLTWGLLGLFVLFAIVDRGRRRPVWIGGGLLGGGYLLLALAHTSHLPLPTNHLLNALRRWVPAIIGGTAGADARILDALEKPIAMSFPEPTPLRDVLEFVTLATATSTYAGIPIYLDPVGLQEADRRPSTLVTIDLPNVALKVSLRECLNSIGLDYEVKDGLLRVEYQGTLEDKAMDAFLLVGGSQHWVGPLPFIRATDLDDPFLVVGHCLLALLAAGVGAIVAPLVADSSVRSAGSPPGGPIE